jgi:hypothetical protein
LIAALAITVALFWTVVLAVWLSLAWFWRATGGSFFSWLMPRWMLSPSGGGRRRPASF